MQQVKFLLCVVTIFSGTIIFASEAEKAFWSARNQKGYCIPFDNPLSLMNHPQFVSVYDRQKDRKKQVDVIELNEILKEKTKWRVMKDVFYRKPSSDRLPERELRLRSYHTFVPFFNRPMYRIDKTMTRKNTKVQKGEIRTTVHNGTTVHKGDGTIQPKVETESCKETMTKFGRKFLIGTAVSAVALFGVLYQFRSRK